MSAGRISKTICTELLIVPPAKTLMRSALANRAAPIECEWADTVFLDFQHLLSTIDPLLNEKTRRRGALMAQHLRSRRSRRQLDHGIKGRFWLAVAVEEKRAPATAPGVSVVRPQNVTSSTASRCLRKREISRHKRQ